MANTVNTAHSPSLIHSALSTGQQHCIAQITDLHLLLDIHALHEGANPYQNLLTTLDHIHRKQTHFSCMLMTGDLVQNINAETYQLLADTLNRYTWNMPIYWLPGNHDNIQLAKQVLTPHGYAYPQSIELGDWSVVCLNSTVTGKSSGLLSASYIQQQQRYVTNLNAKHIVLALHHHLVPCCSFMDKYLTQFDDTLPNWLNAEPRIKALVHGHIHAQRHYVFAGKPVYASPATSVEYVHDRDTFLTGRKTAGYTEITLNSGTIAQQAAASSSSIGTVDVKAIWL